jgi:hypothetical protein
VVVALTEALVPAQSDQLLLAELPRQHLLHCLGLCQFPRVLLQYVFDVAGLRERTYCPEGESPDESRRYPLLHILK